MRRRGDSAGPSGDAGMTLAELLVGVVVAAMVVAAAGTLFAVGMRSNATSTARLTTINQARVSVEAMGRSLRTAVLPSQLDDAGNTDTAFLQGEANAVSFYANINNLNNTVGPSRVTYTVNAARQLVQTVQPPLPNPVSHDFKYCDPALAGCVKTVTVLAEGVDVSVPLFRYYDSTGAVISYATTCPDGNACLSGTSLGNVDAVDLTLVLRTSGVSIGPTTYVLRVSLPNHDSVIIKNVNTP